MPGHCAHARYVWDLAVEQHSHWYKGRKAAPGFAEQCRQLTEARRDNEWLAAGNADVQQQALKDFGKARTAEYAKVATLKAREADRREDWCEKTSTMLARTCDLVRFEKLNIRNMTASARGTVDEPGEKVRQKAGLNRVILAQGWGLVLRRRTGHKAPDVWRTSRLRTPVVFSRCRRVTTATVRSSAREPQPTRVGTPLS